MTREEVIRYGKEYLHDLETACCKIGEIHLNFVRDSIKALEQEPCEDCVSRADLYKWADESFECSFAIKEELAKLPPVTPTHTETVTEFADRCRECGKQKKGKWIKRENIHGLEQYYQCSNCGNHCLYEYVEIGFKNAKTKYCPNCGAEMESEE